MVNLLSPANFMKLLKLAIELKLSDQGDTLLVDSESTGKGNLVVPSEGRYNILVWSNSSDGGLIVVAKSPALLIFCGSSILYSPKLEL